MSNTETLSKDQTTVTMPGEYYVMLHNDEKTTFNFVIDILTYVFGHDNQTAEDLTHKIHHEGKAVVGMYNKEIAEQKKEETMRLAIASGFPLKATVEPA